MNILIELLSTIFLNYFSYRYKTHVITVLSVYNGRKTSNVVNNNRNGLCRYFIKHHINIISY